MKRPLISLFLSVVVLLIGTSQLRAEGNIAYLTKEEFNKKVVNVADLKNWKYLGTKPAIIDFTASWCPPCKQLAPILDELSVKYSKEIVIYKVDVDAERSLAQSFGVKSIPMMLFIPMEGEPEKVTGLLPKDRLDGMIKSHLLKEKK